MEKPNLKNFKKDPMQLAIHLGSLAYSKGEVPIGAVIVHNDEVIAKAYNTREHDQIATHHAEIKAIQTACRKLKSWRLDDCDIYVTLEPCPMCAGAIMNARLRSLHYALDDASSGAISKYGMLNDICLNSKTAVFVDNKYSEEVKNLITSFFKQARKNKTKT